MLFFFLVGTLRRRTVLFVVRAWGGTFFAEARSMNAVSCAVALPADGISLEVGLEPRSPLFMLLPCPRLGRGSAPGACLENLGTAFSAGGRLARSLHFQRTRATPAVAPYFFACTTSDQCAAIRSSTGPELSRVE